MDIEQAELVSREVDKSKFQLLASNLSSYIRTFTTVK